MYTGPGGVLTGAARAAQEAQEKASELMHREENELKKRELDRKSKVIEAQITASNSEFEAAQEGLNKLIRQEEMQEKARNGYRAEMIRLRKADVYTKNQS